jgi:VanZ family protein
LAILILLFGLSIEIAQSMTSYRHGDIWDLVANGVGIASIWLLLELRRRTV